MKGTLFIQTTCLYQISFVWSSSVCSFGLETVTASTTPPHNPTTDNVAIFNIRLPVCSSFK